jgi:hypothetical protein
MRALLVAAAMAVAASALAQTVVGVSGSQITVSVGSRDGVREGMTGKVTTTESVGGRLETLDVAYFRVTRADATSAQAVLTEVGPGVRITTGMDVVFNQPLVRPTAGPSPTERPRPSPTLPPDPVELLRQGNAAWDAGDWERAASRYERLLEVVPGNPIAAGRAPAARARAEQFRREVEERDRREREVREAAELGRRNLPLYRETVATLLEGADWGGTIDSLGKLSTVVPLDPYVAEVATRVVAEATRLHSERQYQSAGRLCSRLDGVLAAAQREDLGAACRKLSRDAGVERLLGEVRSALRSQGAERACSMLADSPVWPESGELVTEAAALQAQVEAAIPRSLRTVGSQAIELPAAVFNRVEVSPQGELALVFARGDKALLFVVDLLAGRVGEVPFEKGAVSTTHVSFHGDSRAVLLLTSRTLRRLGTADLKVEELGEFQDYSRILASPAGDFFVGLHDNEIEMWSLAGASPKKLADVGSEFTCHIAFSPDGRLFGTDVRERHAKAGLQQHVRLYDPKTMSLLARYSSEKGSGSCSTGAMTFSPDSKEVLIGNGGATRVWSSQGLSPRPVLPGMCRALPGAGVLVESVPGAAEEITAGGERVSIEMPAPGWSCSENLRACATVDGSVLRVVRREVRPATCRPTAGAR